MPCPRGATETVQVADKQTMLETMTGVRPSPSDQTAGKKRPLYALHVFASLDRGGAETWLMDVMRHLGGHSLRIDVCVIKENRGAYEDEFERLGGRVHRCPLGRNVLSFNRRFRDLLARENYDVVHSHLYYFSGLVLRAAAKAGVAIRVAHNHPVEDLKNERATRRLYTWLMMRWMRAFGTHFVGPTRASLEAMWGPHWNRDANKRIIYNGIRIERFLEPVDRNEIRRELGLPESAKIVLNVGRFAPHKRQGILVDVAERVRAERPDVYFVLIGAGPLRDEVQAHVRQKGLEEGFRFVAGLPSIDPYWLSADVFAFPSCNEGFGIVIAEAAAAGLPVVACDIPGVREAAAACPTIELLPVDAPPAAWSDMILRFLNSPRPSDADRRTMLRKFPFTIEASRVSLLDLYGLVPKPNAVPD